MLGRMQVQGLNNRGHARTQVSVCQAGKHLPKGQGLFMYLTEGSQCLPAALLKECSGHICCLFPLPDPTHRVSLVALHEVVATAAPNCLVTVEVCDGSGGQPAAGANDTPCLGNGRQALTGWECFVHVL